MRKSYLVLLIIFGLIGLITVIFYIRLFFIPKGITINKDKYPVTGIDVSKHSGQIDWQKIKKQDVDFAFIKATEGEDYTDPEYLINSTQAAKAGIISGAYHFFRFNKTGMSQAENFLVNANFQMHQLPPVIDIEEWGNYFKNKTTAQIKDEMKIFIDAVESQQGKRVIIYTNTSTYNKYIKNDFSENPIWICSFNHNLKLSDDRKWLFWQHAHNGKIEGIQGNADINTFNGNKTQFNNYVLSQ